MSKVPHGLNRQELYVVARRVLLDALIGLTDQRDAIVVVGAQAVYLRCGDTDLSVAAYTSDADLGIDPRRLSSEPELAGAMRAAGFTLRSDGGPSQPGTWIRYALVGGVERAIPVDLLIPAQLSGTGVGRRTASIPPHDRMAARKIAVWSL